MEALNQALGTVAGYVWGLPLIVLLVGTGVLLSITLKFIQIRRYGLAVKIISGRYDDPSETGEVSHFRALTSALSGTIGLGNIAGVAVAISLGGPGALFWMWITALFGMATKYATCLLANRYRTVHEDGSVSGGPMYTIENAMGKSWKPLAAAFAVFTIGASFGMANLFQSNQVASSLYEAFSVPTWATGLGIVVFVALVIIGGIKRIGAVTGRLVPLMCGIYIVAAIVVLILKAEAVPDAFALIFTTAFTGVEPAAGGFAGIAFWIVLQQGVRRGTFSNEAGLGSAPIAHAAAKTREPVREGLVAMMGPFIDTITICTMTALVIISTGTWKLGSPPKVKASFYSAATAEAPAVERGPTIREAYDRGGDLRGTDVRWTGEVFVVQKMAFEDRVGLHLGGGMRESCFAVFPRSLGAADELQGGERITIQGKLHGDVGGAVLTTFAFSTVFGEWGGVLIIIGILFFALSTIITWSYYGDRAAMYLFGPRGVLPYRILYVIVIFIGAIYTLDAVVNISDILNGLMAIPNLIVTLVLLPKVIAMTRDYLERHRG